MRRLLLLNTTLLLAACVTPTERVAVSPPPPSAASSCPAQCSDTPASDRLIAELQLKLLAREADFIRLQSDVDEVKQRLDDAILEIVRSKAKMGSLGSHAEAATALSESELLLSSMRRERGTPAGELAAAEKMLTLANKEFKNGNFGGAFYLSSTAKTALGLAASRLRSAAPSATEASAEVKFRLPVKIVFIARANVRESPRTDSRVIKVAEKGASSLGIAHRDRWVLVEFDDGTQGWSFHDLLGAR